MIATEHQEQVSLFQWAESVTGLYPCLRWMYAVPNGGKRNKITAYALKREGVKVGISDVVLPAARGGYHGLYIEMKRTKGWIEAKETIERYLRCS